MWEVGKTDFSEDLVFTTFVDYLEGSNEQLDSKNNRKHCAQSKQRRLRGNQVNRKDKVELE